MKVQEYKQLKAFTRFDGLILGLIMCVTFVMFLVSLHDPSYQVLYLAGMLCAPIFVALRVRYYRDRVLMARVSFRRAAAYGTLCFVYGALILAVVCYAYFKFFDGGNFYATLCSYFSQPEMKAAMKIYGVDGGLLKEQLSSLAEMRPVDIALSMVYDTIFAGIFCSLLIALVSRRNPRVVRTQREN